jgi:hypothetical protein
MTAAETLLTCLADLIVHYEPSVNRELASAELLRIFGDLPAQLRELREQYNDIHALNKRNTHGGKE